MIDKLRECPTCPYCGGNTMPNYADGYHYAQCISCGAKGPSLNGYADDKEVRERAIQKAFHRPTESALKAEIHGRDMQIEELQHRIKELEAEAELGNIPYREAIALQKRVGELEARQKWISVEDGLPEQQCHCLVWAPKSFPKNTKHVVAEFYDDNQTFYSESSDESMPDVTYWMPLPTPPETEERT